MSVSPDDRTFYYVHYLNKEKRDDNWLSSAQVRAMDDISSIRAKVGSQESESSSPIDHSTTGQLWPGFFQLSQLSKQTTAGSSAYGAAASSTHHDPFEYAPKTIVGITLGAKRIKSWYRSPYPKRFWSLNEYLRVCECCLSYGFRDGETHACSTPPSLGQAVYTKNNIVITEVDGLEATQYCERLFLLSKLFLEDKRTSADEHSQTSQVIPFLFYVLTEKNADGSHRFVGYFSKYKIQKRDSPILSCILVLPSEQRKGYGKLLISAAYELSKREGRQGSAERPLSGPGYAAFMSWWLWRLGAVVADCYDGEVLSIAQLSHLSGMTSEDVVETLKFCGALKQWGSAGGDVKLRESGKRAKVRMTMDILRALQGKSGKAKTPSPNDFDASLLSDTVRLCPVVTTPTK